MIKDQISVGDVMLNSFPTKSIPDVHFTKPLQSSMFQKLRVDIPRDMLDADLGWDQTYKYVVTSLQECFVGNRIPMEPNLQDNGQEAEGMLK